MSRISETLEKFKNGPLKFAKEQVKFAGFTDEKISEQAKAAGTAGFGIPEQSELDEDDLRKNKTLIDILARLYKKDPEEFVKPLFDQEYEASRRILNEVFTYDFANWRKSQLHLNSESPDTTPITLTKTSVRASITDETPPEQAAKQALEMAYLAANNPVLMNNKEGVQLSYKTGDEQTGYFLYLAAEKMGFADKVLEAGYQPPEIPEDVKARFQSIIDNAYNDMAQVAKHYAHPAEEPDQSAEEPERPAPETDTEPQAAQTSQPDTEPHIAEKFNDIVNDPRYQIAVDYAAENGTISRAKLENHIRKNGQSIGSSTITKIFNVMEDQGIVSEPGPQGRKYLGDTGPEKQENKPAQQAPSRAA